MLAVFMVVVLVSACSGESEGTDVPVSDLSPSAVTAEWLDAVVAGDFERIVGLVEPTGLAVVVAVENNLRSTELAALLESGLPDDLRAQYWSDFREDFTAFRSSPHPSA